MPIKKNQTKGATIEQNRNLILYACADGIVHRTSANNIPPFGGFLMEFL